MKVWSTLLAMIFSLSVLGKNIPVYYNPVNMPAALKTQYYGGFDTRLLAEDLAALLCCLTGDQYIPRAFAGNMVKNDGVYLLLDSRYQGSTNETGTVNIENGKVVIRAKYVTGLSYALYSWLHHLGFRFYLPGNEWAIYPAKSNLPKNFHQTYSPHFKQRIFNPSGGAFAVKGIDDDGKMKEKWHVWYRRNRMGADYLKIDGHKGELFNIQHRSLIESDPRMVAPIEGKRQYRTDAKPDPTYSPGVELFTDWLVKQHQAEQKTFPNFFPHKKYQSGDLGDGLNYCHTPECLNAFPTVSDQNFFLMNKAASKIKMVDEEAGISTLAYTERADTPTVRIEPNVHVMVVASAFQNVSTATELVKRWKRKTDNISVYDFLNIGVWQHDHPFFNLKRYHGFLELLKRMNVQGITMETSWSALASGIQQYLILQYLCEPYEDIDEQYNKMCEDLFGKATVKVKRIFNRWYFSDVHLQTNIESQSFYPDELAYFLHYGREAASTAGLLPEEKWRIQQIQAYTVYLCGFYELFQDPEKKELYKTNPERKKEDAEDLLNYTWSQYHSGVFHQTQLNDLLKKHVGHAEKWDFRKATIPSSLIKEKDRLRNERLEHAVKKYSAYFKPELAPRSLVLKTLLPYAAEQFTVSSIDEKNFGKYLFTMDAYTDKPGLLEISYSFTGSSEQHQQPEGIIALESDDLTYTREYFLKAADKAGSIKLNLPAAGNYRLIVGYLKPIPIEFTISAPGVLVYLNKKSLLRNAFQVVKENSEGQLAVNAPEEVMWQQFFPETRNTVSFLSPEGKALPTEKLSGFRYRVRNHSATKPFLYYKNEVMRWPAVLLQSPEIYFFARKPATGL